MEESRLSSPLDGGKSQKSPIIGCYGFWVILTYSNAAVALLGMYHAFNGSVRYALICLMVSGLCDGFDGKVANLKERTSREKSYGIQIDALADVISFGVLPAVIGYTLIGDYASKGLAFLSLLIFIWYVLAALIRLAYFNVIEAELVSRNEKRKYFEGLPVTSVALIIPFVYSVCCVSKIPLYPVYTVLLAAISAAFVLRIKIPKPRIRAIAILCMAGIPTIIYIIFFGGGR